MIVQSAQYQDELSQNQYIKVKTIDWVRKYLAEIELNVRQYAKSNNTHAIEVSAFIDAIDLRANDYIILNDDETYAKGVLAMYHAGLTTEEQCQRMLEAGNHDAMTLMDLTIKA